MTFSISTLITASLFGALLLIGSISPVLAGDGCGKDKKEMSTSGLSTPSFLTDDRAG